MLYQVASAIFSILLIGIGLSLLVAVIRVSVGSGDAYDQLKGISKGFWETMFGDVKQPEGRGGILYNRGIAYTVDADGKVEFIRQAKSNRESLRDSSV